MNFGLPELLIILVIVLILFGSTRLPKLSRSIGKSMKELRMGFGGESPPKDKKKSSKNTEDAVEPDKEPPKDEPLMSAASESEPENSFYKSEKKDKEKN